MHDTALKTGAQFFRIYLNGRGRGNILDVGSLNVNGSLRQCAPADLVYTGVDLAPGSGVDIVLKDSYKLPFPDGAFDAVVSTSCFEHDPMFWLTFSEMVRVTTPGGTIYISAPSNGWYHCYPMDNWRFYPDAGLSLVAWARHQGLPLDLLESFITRRQNDIWNDCVMVFEKGPAAARSAQRICDTLPNAMNVRRSDRPNEVLNRVEATEDQQYLSSLMKSIGIREKHIARLEQELHKVQRAIQPA